MLCNKLGHRHSTSQALQLCSFASLALSTTPRIVLLLCCCRETGGTGYLDFIQQQEEEALQTALQKLRQQEAEGKRKD